MRISQDALADILTRFPAAKRRFATNLDRSNFEVLPGVVVDKRASSDFSDFVYDLFSRLTPLMSKTVIEEGVLVNSDDMTALPQLLQNPSLLPYPLSQPKKVDTEETERMEKLVHGLARYAFSNGEFTNIQLNSVSTSGAFTYHFDRTKKKQNALRAIANCEEILNICTKITKDKATYGDLYEAGLPCVYTVNRRVQETDKVNVKFNEVGVTEVSAKVRRVWDGKKFVYQDRMYAKNFSNRPLAAPRERLFYGSTSEMSTLVSVLGNFLQNSIKKTLPRFYDNSHAGMSKAVKTKKSIFTLDVSNFDTNIAARYIRAMLSAIDGLDPRVIDLVLVSIYAPVVTYQKTQYENQVVILRGDDMKWEERVATHFGNPSGHPLTSVINKIVGGGLFLEITAQLDGFDVLTMSQDEVNRWINSKMQQHEQEGKFDTVVASFSGGNSGDNIFFAEEAAVSVIKPLIDFSNLSFPIDVQEVATYCGFNFLRNQEGLKPIYKTLNLLTRTLIPEVPLSHPRKKLYKIGFNCRLELYRDNPFFREVMQVLKDTLLRHYNFDILGPEMAVSAYDKALLGISAHGADLDAIAEFIEDPNKIHYKLDIAKLPPELLRTHYEPLTPAEYEPAIKSFFKTKFGGFNDQEVA